MCTTGPQFLPSISSNRCSARARWCAARYGVGPRRCARRRPPAAERLRLPLSLRGHDLLHVQLEARHPALLHLEFGHHVVGILTCRLPAAAVGLRLPLFQVTAGREHQRVALTGDGAAAETAGALDVQILQLPRRRIPHVNRFAETVGMAFAMHHVIAHELAAVDPAEAVLIGCLAVGERALPAVAY